MKTKSAMPGPHHSLQSRISPPTQGSLKTAVIGFDLDTVLAWTAWPDTSNDKTTAEQSQTMRKG